MDKGDKEEFARIMFGLAENFRDSITDTGLRFRFEAMQRFSVEQIRAAAMDIVNSRKFTKFPTIAEFVTRIEGDREQITADTAEIEARRVVRLVHERGYTNPPSFDDPVTAELISRQFSWGSLCRTLTEDQETWFVRDFVRAYQAMAREEKRLQLQGPSEEIRNLLAGIGEDGN